MPSVREIMTPHDVADYLQLAPETVYRYIREGKLVASKLGRQYRVSRRSVDLLMLSTATAGEAQLRTFSRDQVNDWLKEDEIDEEIGATGERLLAALRRD
jgi:excisionase family DNA binding protein